MPSLALTWLCLLSLAGGRISLETRHILPGRIPIQCVRCPKLHVRMESAGIVQASNGDPDEFPVGLGVFSARETRATVGAESPLVKPAGCAGGAVILGRSLGKLE